MLIELFQHLVASAIHQATGILDAAFADSARRQERWCIAELLRMKAEMLLSVGASGSEAPQRDLASGPRLGSAGKAPCRGNFVAASGLARLRRKGARIDDGRACL